MEKELNALSLEETLDAARKEFLEEDLSSLDFEIEELESRLAFVVTTEGGGWCVGGCQCG
ncbi:hypothetical protein EPA93_45625 [Ktedonosporobacter rubrisoli]|uniref:Uncharacterized protein n=1 Tax=Ktedonosporobacter rubrisoli TaxID=2509675 RepID=A0A4V0Z0D7_KTERU|nr:hypothetical protein [Ktedonosporobacter rubrisoli]QBD82861.1 hypothetical protein EPA93_45625 [Ktedonosporobacter rubrisoli]